MTKRLERWPALRRWLSVAVTVLLALGIWSAGRSQAASWAVSIKDFSFQPPDLTVRVGDQVTWTNHDSETHAVQGGPLSSPDLAPGDSYSFTFTSTGDVSYICRIHTYMNGVVHVVNDNATTTTTAPPSTTTSPPESTTTTAEQHQTTTTTEPGATTTTSTTTPRSTTTTTAPPSGAPAFQDVPDDPSARNPPGSPGADQPPPQSKPTTTTSSTTSTTAAPPPGYQEVPPDASGSHPPSGPSSAEAVAPTDLGDGTYLAPYSDEGGVKTFHLTMAPTTIEVAPGVTKDAYAFNGIVPGPVLRVNEGDRVRIQVDNQLPFPTAVHWHGMILPNDQDGVPGLTQPFIEPGDRYTYEWTALAPGTHWYHTHSSGRHIGKGLYGALEVVPRTADFAADRDYRVILGDTDLGFVINGRSFPSTKPLVTKVGETVRLRVIDAGDQVHAIHLHGTPFDVVAQDGNKLGTPARMDTLTISPGQTFDLLAKEPNPGKWLLHCHIFAHSHMTGDDHMSGDTGMTGMVTMLDVRAADSALAPGVPSSALLATERIANTSLRHGGLSATFVARLARWLLLSDILAVALTRRRFLTWFPTRKDTLQ